MTNNQQLLPCVHCGAPGQIKRGKTVLVSCTECTASTFQLLGDPQSAIVAWNRRANENKDALDAARYRWLRDQRGIQGDFPIDGDVWVVQMHQPNGTIPELRCAGFGDKLDRVVDAAISAEKKEGA